MKPRYVVFALVALMLAIGAYRELRAPSPVAPPPPTPTPTPTKTAATTKILSVRSDPARNNTEQEVIAQAPTGVECSIEHAASDGSTDADDALAPKRADFQGHVSWRWKLEFPGFIEDARTTMKITVTCDGAKAERTYELQR